MKIGVAIAPLAHFLEDIQEAGEVVFVREAGIKHVEIHTNFLDKYLNIFLKMSEETGITYSVHLPHMYFSVPTNYCSAVPETIKISDEWLAKSINYAKQIDAKNIIIHADIPEECSKQEALNLLEKHIRDNFALLNKGQRILIENMPGKNYSLSTPKEFKGFLKRFKNSKKIGMCWDIGHEIQRHGKLMFDFPNQLGSKIKEVHISGVHKSKNVHEYGDHYPINKESVLDLKKIGSLLKEINYNGVIIMEIITYNPAEIIESKNEVEKAVKLYNYKRPHRSLTNGKIRAPCQAFLKKFRK